MLVATAVAAFGFVAVATGTRQYGLRLGGTVVLGVLAVYTLKNFSTLPIFLASTTIAYLTLGYAKRKTLIYGRDEFVVAIVSGSLAPAMLFLTTLYLPGNVQIELYRSVFIGSLLSGVTAFNLHQIRPGYKWKDVAGAAGIYVTLLALGALLVGPSTRFLADYTPLVLFANTSDIAVLRGAVVEGFVDPEFVGRPFIIGVFAGMLGLSELVRQRFGVRIGTIALGLVAIYTVSTWRLLALYLVIFAIVFAVITALHRTVVFYGRALLSTAAALGVVVAVPLVIALDISAGLSALFAAVLASLMAYYVHHTSPPERYQQAALAVAVFVPVLLVVRAVVAPGPDGVPQAFGVREIGLGVAVTAAAIAVAERHHVEQPSDADVRAASLFKTEEN
jgi:hypothetical protein